MNLVRTRGRRTVALLVETYNLTHVFIRFVQIHDRCIALNDLFSDETSFAIRRWNDHAPVFDARVWVGAGQIYIGNGKRFGYFVLARVIPDQTILFVQFLDTRRFLLDFGDSFRSRRLNSVDGVLRRTFDGFGFGRGIRRVRTGSLRRIGRVRGRIRAGVRRWVCRVRGRIRAGVRRWVGGIRGRIFLRGDGWRDIHGILGTLTMIKSFVTLRKRRDVAIVVNLLGVLGIQLQRKLFPSRRGSEIDLRLARRRSLEFSSVKLGWFRVDNHERDRFVIDLPRAFADHLAIVLLRNHRQPLQSAGIHAWSFRAVAQEVGDTRDDGKVSTRCVGEYARVIADILHVLFPSNIGTTTDDVITRVGRHFGREPRRVLGVLASVDDVALQNSPRRVRHVRDAVGWVRWI